MASSFASRPATWKDVKYAYRSVTNYSKWDVHENGYKTGMPASGNYYRGIFDEITIQG
jgi:hypothetical protein